MSKYLVRLLMSLLILSVAAPVFAVTAEEISNELVCQCGCALVLENCNHSDCGSADPMRVLVRQKVEAGQSKAQILEYFVAQYGEAVLAAPTKRGFNLTVWIAPFAAIVAGAAVIGWLISVWVRRRRIALVVRGEAHVPEGNSAVEQRYESVFERELKDFE